MAPAIAAGLQYGIPLVASIFSKRRKNPFQELQQKLGMSSLQGLNSSASEYGQRAGESRQQSLQFDPLYRQQMQRTVRDLQSGAGEQAQFGQSLAGIRRAGEGSLANVGASIGRFGGGASSSQAGIQAAIQAAMLSQQGALYNQLGARRQQNNLQALNIMGNEQQRLSGQANQQESLKLALLQALAGLGSNANTAQMAQQNNQRNETANLIAQLVGGLATSGAFGKK